MKKSFLAAPPVHRNSNDSLQNQQLNFKKRFNIEAIIVFSLLFLLVVFLAVTFLTSGTIAAPLPYQTWQERYKFSTGGADIPPTEFNERLDSSVETVKRTSIYRNGINRSGGIALPVFPTEGRLTGGFGGRSNPFGAGGGEFHAGLDVAAPTGTGVLAAADGVVTFSGWKGGYGNVIIIEHDGQQVVTRYGHLSRRYVEEGDTVTAGRLIGSVGSTGRSTGPHLHYEVRIDGKPTNPLAYHSQSQTE